MAFRHPREVRRVKVAANRLRHVKRRLQPATVPGVAHSMSHPVQRLRRKPVVSGTIGKAVR